MRSELKSICWQLVHLWVECAHLNGRCSCQNVLVRSAPSDHLLLQRVIKSELHRFKSEQLNLTHISMVEIITNKKWAPRMEWVLPAELPT